jgi:hypothetical protein
MAVKRILKYLVHTPSFGLWYLRGSTFDLVRYSDQMLIMPDVSLIGRTYHGLVSFLEDLWCLGFHRNKTQ